jgi:hypothetical protein
VRGKGASKFDRMLCRRLVSHIYENPVETEVGLTARIISVCANIKKNTPGTLVTVRSGHCASLLRLQ